jgi:hypothetical protein
VKRKEDIRLLLTGNNEAEKWSSVAYIEHLHPNPAIYSVIEGFAKGGHTGWQNDKWNPIRCKEAYNKIQNKR